MGVDEDTATSSIAASTKATVGRKADVVLFTGPWPHSTLAASTASCSYRSRPAPATPIFVIYWVNWSCSRAAARSRALPQSARVSVPPTPLVIVPTALGGPQCTCPAAASPSPPPRRTPSPRRHTCCSDNPRQPHSLAQPSTTPHIPGTVASATATGLPSVGGRIAAAKLRHRQGHRRER
jgi:hypothetical protein